jgi:hypothetical protein
MSRVREHVNEIPNRVAQAVVSNYPEQVRRVDSEVKAILDSMDVRELLEFADAVRRSYRWHGATRPAWLTMRPYDVRALRHSEAVPTAILGGICARRWRPCGSSCPPTRPGSWNSVSAAERAAQ